MKKIFKYIIPCLAVACTLASCDDVMDDKASIDAQYESLFKTATVAVSSATSPSYDKVAVTCAVGNPEDVAEEGIQFSSTNDFTNADFTPNGTVEASYTQTVSGLEETTTYYVRAYAVSKNGKVVYSDVQSVTTVAAPRVDLNGTYTATEYDRNNGGGFDLAGTYKVTIEFDKADPTKVYITNIWEAESTVEGTYDAATETITVPSEQVIYNHPSYGKVWIQGVNDAFTAYTDVTFSFNPRGGRMVSSKMGAICAAGAFGYFYLDMQHD